ncbi:hypothetical protein U1Q18_018963 [Sarracenia purpurea var. burkii]
MYTTRLILLLVPTEPAAAVLGAADSAAGHSEFDAGFLDLLPHLDRHFKRINSENLLRFRTLAYVGSCYCFCWTPRFWPTQSCCCFIWTTADVSDVGLCWKLLLFFGLHDSEYLLLIRTLAYVGSCCYSSDFTTRSICC